MRPRLCYSRPAPATRSRARPKAAAGSAAPGSWCSCHFVALPLGVDVLLGCFTRGAGGADLLGRGVDGARRGADVDRDVLPRLRFGNLRRLEVEASARPLGARPGGLERAARPAAGGPPPGNRLG